MDEVLFIYRAKEFSPNNVGKDKTILDKVRERLELAGMKSRVVAEEELVLPKDSEGVKAIVGMERRLGSLLKVQQCGIRAFNSANGILNVATSRELTLLKLEMAGVGIPRYWVFDPEDDEMFQCEPHLQALLPAWVKAMRHDGARPGDVVFVETPLEADTEIARLWMENVQDIVLTSHVHGDLIKVYAVTNSLGEIQFLRWFYPQETGYTKFGEEEKNDALRHVPFDQSLLRKTVRDIARGLELQFFGFDAIVDEEKITVIDVNDWPSYSICQDEAADNIARTILADIETY